MKGCHSYKDPESFEKFCVGALKAIPRIAFSKIKDNVLLRKHKNLNKIRMKTMKAEN
jgi:hypothetical protein